jgi:hypothetical protein
MHASLEQLIALRDGEPVDAAIKAHAHACRECNARIDSLADLRTHLSGLPVFGLPEDAWDAIAARVRKYDEMHAARRRRRGAAGIAIAASVAVAAGVWMFRMPSYHQPETSAAVRPSAASLSQLVDQSRSLEGTVISLNASADHMAISAGTAATVAALEDRIALVDYQINSASAHVSSSPELTQLWQQRVDLLQSLAAVRYAQVANDSI